MPQTEDANVQVLSFTFGSLYDHLDEELEEFSVTEVFGDMVEYHRRRPNFFSR